MEASCSKTIFSDQIYSNEENKEDTTIDLEGNDKEDMKTKIQESALRKLQKSVVPNLNVPERIIICLDLSAEEGSTEFNIDNVTFSALNIIQRTIELFVYNKLAINSKVQFALMVLKDSAAMWLQDFTNDIEEFISTLENCKEEECTTDEFDFDKVFEVIKENVQLPHYNPKTQLIPPANVLRLIVIYGRSDTIPKVPNDEPFFQLLKKHLYFYIDILYSHEDNCTTHKCAQIYDMLQDMDNGYSYVFEVARHPSAIHNCMAKLLAHPLQRPLQKNTFYKLSDT